MSQITFNGFYGYKNTGDDAFVEVASWGNKFYWKNKELPYFTGNKLPITQTPIQPIYSSTSNKALQKLSVFANTLKSDYIINAGGSIFSEIRPLSNISFAIRAGFLNTKLKHGAIGVSIGPFTNTKDEKDVEKYLKGLEFLALRDTKSYEYAMSLDLNYKPVQAFDLAALLPICYKDTLIQRAEETQKTIGVSLCNYEKYIDGDLENEERRNHFANELLVYLSKNKNYRFKFFIFNGNDQIGDEELTLKTTQLLSENQFEIVPYSENTFLTWQEIQACDFMLSTRLHASIFAFYADVPFMLIEYHRKCGDFLDDIGYNPKLRLFDGERSPQEVSFDIENILSGNYERPTNLEQTVERAKHNFTHIQL